VWETAIGRPAFGGAFGPTPFVWRQRPACLVGGGGSNPAATLLDYKDVTVKTDSFEALGIIDDFELELGFEWTDRV